MANTTMHVICSNQSTLDQLLELTMESNTRRTNENESNFQPPDDSLTVSMTALILP
jgi:hypothetical protein